MIRTFKRLFALALVVCLYQGNLNAQIVQIIYENGSLNASKTAYTFNFRAVRGIGYNVADVNNSNWQFMNIRSDIEVPAGVTITSTGFTLDPMYSSGAGVSNNTPGSPPPGWAEFSINITRTSQSEIPEGAGAVLGTVTLNFSGPVLNSNKVTIRPFNGTTTGAFWTNLDGSVARRPIDGTADLPLPVKLIDFSAAREGNTATLSWSTSEEINSKLFDVERSLDGKIWGIVKSVPAKGESTVVSHYSAVDDSPMEGNNLYRLKMVDKDGTSAFSKIRNVEFDLKSEYLLYPNPAENMINLKSVTDWKQVSKIQMFNANGVEVYTSPFSPTKEISVKNLASGTYVVKLTRNNNRVSNYKVVIAR
jgi:hypothetical protein